MGINFKGPSGNKGEKGVTGQKGEPASFSEIGQLANSTIIKVRVNTAGRGQAEYCIICKLHDILSHTCKPVN